MHIKSKYNIELYFNFLEYRFFILLNYQHLYKRCKEKQKYVNTILNRNKNTQTSVNN